MANKKHFENEISGVVNIDMVADELWKYAKNLQIDVLKARSLTTRIGVATDVMRKAVAKSSLGMYNGRLHMFTGKIYEPMRWEDLHNAVYEVMKRFSLDFTELTKYHQVAYATQGFAKSKRLEIDPNVVVFENCIYKIDTDEILTHSAEYVQVTKCEYEYDPTAECPMWEKFLGQVLPSPTIQAILQEFLGAIFLDRKKSKFEHMLILQGSGSNGKGVVFEVVNGIVGKDNVTNFGLDALLSGADQKKNIALMNGKRVNYCSEIQALESGKYADKLKTLISGEPVEARALYGENYMAHDIPIMIANANKLPLLRDSSYGMQRRVLIIPFTKVIPVELQDTQLPTTLRTEYSGIFNWFMEGRQRFIARDFKFTKSAEVRKKTEEFMAASNNVIRFMMDQSYYPVFESVADIVPATIQVSDLYQQYLNWCVKNKEKSTSMLYMSKDLVDAGYTKKKNCYGTSFQVYGEAASELIKQREDEMQKFYTGLVGRSHAPLFKDGRMYGRGDFNAAFYAHVSRPWLSTMRIKGKLDSCFEYNGPTPIYDIDKLVRRIEQLGAYVDQDHKLKSLAQRESDRIDATNFNEQMKAAGKPFRKMVYGMTVHNTEVVVPNEWEWNEEAEQIALRENAERMLNKID